MVDQPRGTSTNTHLLAVDLLRGAAIVMVVVYHSFGPVYGYYVPWKGWFRNFAAAPNLPLIAFYPISIGWTGVALFFVLSGFCIHWSFLRSPNFSNPRFFWRRFWRLVPAYYAALIAFSILVRLPLDTLDGIKQIVVHALFIHNFQESTFFEINPSFWSIATEVQLYLLFPMLLLIRRQGGMQACLLFTFSVGALWRILAVVVWGLPDHLITAGFCSPLMTWFDWTLGAYVAECLNQSKVGFAHRRLWLMIVIPLFVLSTLYKPLTTVSFSLAAVISAVILDWSVWTRVPKNALSGIVSFIGTVSYSAYLWHQPLLFQLSSDLNHYMNGPALIASVGILIFALAVLSFGVLERGGILAGKVLLQHGRNRRQ